MVAVLAFRRIGFVAAVMIALGGALHAADLQPAVADFLDRYCTGCHNPEDRKGRLDLEGLDFSPDNRANLALWIKVHVYASGGKMPPKEKRRPDAAELDAFAGALRAVLTDAERQATAIEGRTVQRRLNRYEYENALRDLLDVPWAQVMNQL